MARRVLLYGANGFSGEIIARAAARRWRGSSEWDLVLAGRNGPRLAAMARECGVASSVFSLDDSHAVDAALGRPGTFAVLNAAGPFAFTGEVLAKGALRNCCHYVDINGEADVYRRLDDLTYAAEQRGLALVCGAGHSATTSDLMLARAVKWLHGKDVAEVANIRIVFSHILYPSRGSAQTAWRSIRDQAMFLWSVPSEESAQESSTESTPKLRIGYEPTGRRERCFDFNDADLFTLQGEPRNPRRIAMAANLLDLLTARVRLAAPAAQDDTKLEVGRIDAYMEMPEGARIFVQLGALSTTLHAIPAWRRLVQVQVGLLPEGPTAEERKVDKHTVLLQIDDAAGRPLVDWRMRTPNPYDFTADCALAVVEGLASGKTGWLVPAELLDGRWDELTRPCTFEQRLGQGSPT